MTDEDRLKGQCMLVEYGIKTNAGLEFWKAMTLAFCPEERREALARNFAETERLIAGMK